MLDQGVRALALLAAALLAGCGDPQWARASWPSEAPGQIAQPQTHVEALSLRLSARSITWEPEGLVVELVLVHEGERELVVDPSLVFLGYDGLEYAPALDEAGELRLVPGEEQVIALRYMLGRALTGPGASLRLRGVRLEGEPVVEIAELLVPAMPAHARPR